ncbi:MAG TPA: DegV family protein [Dehalococcoidales bacterium]|nr:DegV family protein [Dehalococcoidales bacterium]
MHQKVAVITDSIACLTRELVEQYGIRIAPINLYFGEKTYRDWVDITPDEAYELFLKDPDEFKTSGSNPPEWMEACRAASRETDSIVCITLSSKLSVVYNSVLDIKKRLQDEIPRLSIEVVDSQTVTASEGFVALAAARAAKEGKSLPEVVRAAEEVRDKVALVAFLDTIRHVYRTGRIPKIAALAGSVLSIRPMLTVSGGVVRFISAVRSRERGIKRMLKTMREKVGKNPVHVAVMHAFAREEGEKLKERVASEFDCVELWLTGFSPVMGYATGTGTLGLAFYED